MNQANTWTLAQAADWVIEETSGFPEDADYGLLLDAACLEVHAKSGLDPEAVFEKVMLG